MPGSRGLVPFVGSVSLLVASLCGCQALQIAATSPASTSPAKLAPTITSQPVNTTVTLGNSATFSVIAAGSGTLSYQWQQNSNNISGATSPSYTAPATTAGDSGNTFDVIVSNGTGSTVTSTTSSPATLTVSAALSPSLTSQPQNASVAIGQTATFSVTATGTGTLNYQWRRNLVNIAGATASIYTMQATTPADG